jgi:hypothetical protein
MGKLIIAILEDDVDRAERMRARLEDRFPYEVRVFAHHTSEMIAWLESHLAETVLISLDHDLNLLPSENGQCVDPGCGRDVADYLATQSPICPVVIHSTNLPAADGMQSTLEESGWSVARVTPYGDLAWIDEAWFPAARRALVDSALPAKMVAKRSAN